MKHRLKLVGMQKAMLWLKLHPNNTRHITTASDTNRHITTNAIRLDSCKITAKHSDTPEPVNCCIRAQMSHNNGIKTALIPVFKNNSYIPFSNLLPRLRKNTYGIISLGDKTGAFHSSSLSKAAVIHVPLGKTYFSHYYTLLQVLLIQCRCPIFIIISI